MFYIGVDLGQKHDHTAVAIVERPERVSENQQRIYNALAPLPWELRVRRVQRVMLGTPYPRVVEMIREITRERLIKGDCAVVVDGTGVGAPVIDMLRAADLGCEITAVTITGGERQSGKGSSWVSVPKKDLISAVQLALEKGELRIARRMGDVMTLVRELVDVQISGTRIGAARAGEHDDLVIALALACWRARRPRNGYGTGILPGFPGGNTGLS
jgi:hypothetical protein